MAQAETIESLIAAGELEARAVVETPSPLLQKSPIVIAVEVGAPRRFKRGIRVRDFVVPGTLVRPVSNFPLSESRRREGHAWSFQSLRFRIYAEQPGALHLPELTVFVSVDTEQYGVVEGELSVQASPLEVEAPPGTEALESWVAAAQFDVEESWQGELEAYQIGDAVTRVRRFTIKDVPAMAIPESPRMELDGLQIYHAPALVDDNTVGNSIKGVREERMVFTFEAGGSYEIPGHRIHWFNLNTSTVEQIDFPSRRFEVAGAVAGAKRDGDSDEALDLKGLKGFLLYGGLAVLAAAISYFLVRWLLNSPGYHYLQSGVQAWKQRRRARAEFTQAAAQQNSSLCLTLIYGRMSTSTGWQLSSVCGDDQELTAISEALMAHAYGDKPPPEPSELMRLWKACTKAKKQQNMPSQLQLNPGPSHQF